MSTGPPRILERIVSLLVPPACREEVVGDLHERFESPMQYATEAFLTVPLVILSRMRRTTDPQVLLIQVFAMSLSFLCAAWLTGEETFRRQLSLLRFAIPVAMAALGIVLNDTYANPVHRSAVNYARGPLLGVLLAFGVQCWLWITFPLLSLSRWAMFWGCMVSLLFTSAIRKLFPPIIDQPLGANAPALWQKHIGGAVDVPPGFVQMLKILCAVIAILLIGTWIAGH
jgi:hypothetical protein